MYGERTPKGVPRESVPRMGHLNEGSRRVPEDEKKDETAKDAETEGSKSDSKDDSGKSQTTDNTKVSEDDDWKTKARKHEDRAKALQASVDKLTSKVEEFESASKSETEKLTDKASKAEKEAVSAKAEASRLRVALAKGLDAVQAKRLIGDSEEELEQDADELLSSFKPKDDEKKAEDEEPKGDPKDGKDDDDSKEDKPEERRRPKERLKTGATGDTEPEETDPAKLAARVPRGF